MPLDMPPANNPTQLQQQGSHPEHSVWIAANAGSGKTKVLVDRLLRLLLAGARPEHILCLTYTKAAAAEMMQRLIRRTRHWVMLDADMLADELEALSGHPASKHECETARGLFFRLTDAHPGLRILTIHSFCQSILSQFPVEAGIPPNFTVLEPEEARRLQRQAVTALQRQASSQPGSALAHAIALLVESDMAESTFHDSIMALKSQHRHLLPLLASTDTLETAIRQLYLSAGMKEDTTCKTLQQRYLPLHMEGYRQQLKEIALKLVDSPGKTDALIAKQLLNLLDQPAFSETDIHAFSYLLLTSGDNTFIQRFPVKDFKQKYPIETDRLHQLGRDCEEYLRDWHLLSACHTSAALMRIGFHFFHTYDTLKRQHHALDFDDFITIAHRLLSDEALSPWILYKLDGYISHLLIDEAQDTSYAQWEITSRLTEEFFAGLGRVEYPRSLFVVGDSKQSIFGFQGAAPEAFHSQLAYYQRKASDVGQEFSTIAMQTSFRSVEAVLQLVDKVFADPTLRQAVEPHASGVEHVSYRSGQPGSITCYPILSSNSKENPVTASWRQPETRHLTTHNDSTQELAAAIATLVAGWLKEGRVLAATGKPICAGDILILVQRRSELVMALEQECHKRGVPIAGRDRLQLSSHLAVRDLLAFGEIVLDRTHDAALAALLTSPLYRVDYNLLTELSTRREAGETLWQRVTASKNARCRLLVSEVEALAKLAHTATPASFYTTLLYRHQGMERFLNAMGHSVRDILSNFLYAVKRYEERGTSCLQGFLHWMANQTEELARDMQQQGNLLRIMTTHSAKGLEAPVVILPDTLKEVDMQKEKLLPFHVNGIPLLLHSGTKAGRSGIFAEAYELRQQQLQQESWRLLYVALTRAADELHIFGHSNRKEISTPKGWYGPIRRAMQEMGAISQPLPESLTSFPWQQPDILHYAPAATHSLAEKEAESEHAIPSLPGYLLQRPSVIPKRRVFASPSHLADTTDTLPLADITTEADSFLSLRSSQAAMTGTLLHRLLHYQANQPYAIFLKRVPALLDWVANGLKEPQRQHILSHLHHLASHKEAVAWLEKPCLSEIAAAGSDHADTIFAGQVDRLIITPDAIYVLDIKTGKAPVGSSSIPAGYHSQMQAYRQMLTPLYAPLPVHTLLLYTENGMVFDIKL